MTESIHALMASKTILVAEDEPLIRECVVAPLRRAGYHVLAAADGVEGAVLFARNYESIDLLITDISMPGMLGTDLARFARRIRPGVHVVFASGSIQLVDPHPSDIIEGAVLLSKPFTIEELLRTVSAIIGAAAPVPAAPGMLARATT